MAEQCLQSDRQLLQNQGNGDIGIEIFVHLGQRLDGRTERRARGVIGRAGQLRAKDQGRQWWKYGDDPEAIQKEKTIFSKAH